MEHNNHDVMHSVAIVRARDVRILHVLLSYTMCLCAHAYLVLVTHMSTAVYIHCTKH